MIKKISFVVVIGFFLAFAPSAKAQQPPKIWKIGVLVSTSRSLDDYRDESLSRGLYNLGYVDGKNVIMEYRYADGQLDRLPQLAAELVKLKVDVIIVYGTRVAVAAKQATSTIPIVIAGAGDPVQAGLVNSFSHPGTNVTGVSRLSPDFIGMRVELIKEVVPKAVRIAALSNPDNPAQAPNLKEINAEARTLAIQLQTVTARSPNDFESAFGAAVKGEADALLVMPDALFHSYPSRLVELAARSRLPAMYDRPEFVEAGGLMSYAVNIADLSLRAARYVDRILKGSKPADLPLEEPIRADLVINLKTAQALGLTIPANVLTRADKVIK